MQCIDGLLTFFKQVVPLIVCLFSSSFCLYIVVCMCIDIYIYIHHMIICLHLHSLFFKWVSMAFLCFSMFLFYIFFFVIIQSERTLTFQARKTWNT